MAASHLPGGGRAQARQRQGAVGALQESRRRPRPLPDAGWLASLDWAHPAHRRRPRLGHAAHGPP
eukprot:9461121-Pyramimonas_sp.AAC.1